MTAHRIHITPPIGIDGLNCRNCGLPIFGAAKVVYGDGQPDWFVYQHASGAESCPSSSVAEPVDADEAHAMIDGLFAIQAAEPGGTSTRSAQSARVGDAIIRLFNAERARKEFAAAGDMASASAAMNAMRGVIEDLPLHDVRSLALRLFIRAARADA